MKLPWKSIFLTLLGVTFLGCAAMSEHFKCNDEDNEKLIGMATMKMGNGFIIPGHGAYFPGGKFVALDSEELAEYALVKKEYNAKLKYWEVRIGENIPGFVVDFVEKEGMREKDIDLAEMGYDRHRYEITAFYWCVNRGVPQACKRWYGVDPREKSVNNFLLKTQDRKLENWEKLLTFE